MAYLKIENRLINTDWIYYIDTNPEYLISIGTTKGVVQISGDEWNNIKDSVITLSNFKEIQNYGYVNLDLVIDVFKTKDNYYSIKFKDQRKNLFLTPINTEGLNEKIFEEIETYVKVNGGGAGGVTAYAQLTGKPKINGVELSGNKDSASLNLAGKDELDLKADKTGLQTLEAKVTQAETDLASKQNKLVAGQNITIDEQTNTISAQGGQGATYTEGNGIKIVGNAISVDENIVATKTSLEKETQDRTYAISKINEEKLNKVIPTLTDGQNYKKGEVAYKTKNGVTRLVRVTKDITNYDNTTDSNTVVMIDNINLVEYPLIRYFIEGVFVKTNTYLYNEGSVYKAKADIIKVTKNDLSEATKFDTVYAPTAFALPTASATVKGGVKIGEGIKVDAQDGAISIDKDKLSVVEYRDADQSIAKGQLVIHADDLYICKEAIATTTGWQIDEQKMEPVDTNTSEVDVIDYDTFTQGDSIKKGKIVVYNNKLYLAKATFNKSATFTEDEANLIETALQIDLANYYKKNEVNAELLKKAEISVPPLQDGKKYVQGQLVVNADGYIVKVKEDIDSYVAATDSVKVEPIVKLDDYVKNEALTTQLSNKADLVLPTIADGKAYQANQLALKNDLLVRVKEGITNYQEANDSTKVETIGKLPIATVDVLGGIKLGNGLEDVANDGKVSVKVNADGYLKSEANGLTVDTTKIQKKLMTGDKIIITDNTTEEIIGLRGKPIETFNKDVVWEVGDIVIDSKTLYECIEKTAVNDELTNASKWKKLNSEDARIGNIATLSTTVKDNIVNAINELKTKLDKFQIKTETEYNNIVGDKGADTIYFITD